MGLLGIPVGWWPGYPVLGTTVQQVASGLVKKCLSLVTFPTLLHPSLPCFFCPSARHHASAGMSRLEEEDPFPARSCLCAGENSPPALTTDEDYGHFRINPYTLISGRFSIIVILHSESLTFASPLPLGREGFLSLAGWRRWGQKEKELGWPSHRWQESWGGTPDGWCKGS